MSDAEKINFIKIISVELFIDNKKRLSVAEIPLFRELKMLNFNEIFSLEAPSGIEPD